MSRLRALLVLAAVGSACASGDASVRSGTGSVIDAPVVVPQCEEIERFADVLTDVEVEYDYSATQSPAELAEAVDAVFGGRLTGRVLVETALAGNGVDVEGHVGYEVHVDRIISGSRDLEPGTQVFVFVFHGSPPDVTGYTDAVRAAAGAPVAVFSYDDLSLGGAPSAAIEGFITSCDAGPLLGWTGRSGDWASLATVGEVLDAADPASASPSTGAPTTTGPAGSEEPATSSIPTTSAPPPSDEEGGIDGEGDAAVWNIDPANPPAPSATTLTALVSRLGCSGGETGKVLNPEVSADTDRVIITFSVEPLADGAYPCPGNDSVPYVVELSEPLGDRELLDGACLSGEAESTSFCSGGALRWSPAK